MPEEFDLGAEVKENRLEEANTGTLYGIAKEAMKDYVQVYLDLTRKTSGLANILPEHVQEFAQKLVVLSGIDSAIDPHSSSAEQVAQEWRRRQAVPFDVESAITKGVYIQLRNRVVNLLNELEQATKGFLEFDFGYIQSHPYMLPILQRLANISSKAELKKRIGNVSDNAISESASRKMSALLNQLKPGQNMSRGQILQSIEPTLEGIVRDLVGRILLESIVANALDDANVPYKLESEYSYLEGVIYNFRADFAIPDEITPKAFIEVRKSSSRHASLYAKDKMFSAINWKGKNQDMLAVIVVDGPWTAETLKVMAKVFDYVVPLNRASDVAEAISAYIAGDNSQLKWIVEFSIRPAN
ncbi:MULTISPECIES: hypothetical protein [Oscillatoriales]|uniref:hypothetical protein n=1 Tax=Oscillatoriophycideae TaxID=1301283 RepID=UPI001F5494AD|nr:MULTISPECIES: hypothetical protein [Oscillatoriales]